MKTKQTVVVVLAGLACVGLQHAVAGADGSHGSSTGLLREVRRVTAAFHDVTNALAAGYASSGSCVSGPQEGAMGVHYPSGALIFDGALDASRPEILIYEQRQRRLRLLGVEAHNSTTRGRSPRTLGCAPRRVSPGPVRLEAPDRVHASGPGAG